MQIANKFETFSEISVPEFVAAWKGFEGSLVDDEALLEGRFGSGDEVAPP